MGAFNAGLYEQELAAAGVAPEQAAAHARALGLVVSEMAYCKDLHRVESALRQDFGQGEDRLTKRIDGLRTELDAVRVGLNGKIDAVRVELNTKIETVRVELDAKIEVARISLDSKIDTLRSEVRLLGRELSMHRWILLLVGAMQAASLGFLVKLVTS